ncbi:unnamed protein product [Closterium sp. Naga37s-1]|nr:unnamed protein product [Closterium sp. Naga37s-1]
MTGDFIKILRSELASTAEGLKLQAETVRSEAAGAASALKAEIALMKAAAERQAAEVAHVRATAAHAEARMNDVELAVAEGKGAREKVRAERSQAGGSAGGHGGAETPEGKRRKLEETGKAEEMEHAAAGGGALIANRGASDGKQAEAEWKAGLLGLRTRVEGLQDRLGTVESRSADRGILWEALYLLPWLLLLPRLRFLDKKRCTPV